MVLARCILILLAVIVNWNNKRGLALSLVIGLSLVVPVNQFTNRSGFYAVCTASDLAIGLLAVWLNTRMSNAVLVFSAYMCASHITGMWFGGADADSPYRVIVKLLEFAEIAACSIMPTLPERRESNRDDLLQSGRGYRKE